MDIDKKIIAIFKVVRPVHWVKNVSVFAGLIFTGQFMNKGQFWEVMAAFITFCLAASATYVFNDILDRSRDRIHPIKKYRPIASGELTPTFAIVLAAGLALTSFILAEGVSDFFALLIVLYLSLQVLYSIYLKNIPVVDIIIIATGFVIRIYAGAYIIDAHLSVWFLLCVISTALFLASGKRRAEIGASGAGGGTRQSLTKYSVDALNSYVTMFANAAWMSWALFTFFESPQASTPLVIFLSEISRTTTINKLLMVTIPITIFGIMRYEGLIFANRTEAPEKLLLTDFALMGSVALWMGIVLFIYYGGITS